jgi:hypothetical protein
MRADHSGRVGDAGDTGDISRYPTREASPGDTDIRGCRPDDGHEPPGDPDIRGYPDAEERPSPLDIKGYPSEKVGASDAAGTPADEFPLFDESGFESLDDYLDHIEDVQRDRQGLPPRLPVDLRQVQPHDARGRSRQVGLRLPETEFRQLRELGDTYGLAPATLARMIVVRAVRSGRLEPPE